MPTDNYGVDPLALDWSNPALVLGGSQPVPCFESVRDVRSSISIQDGPQLSTAYFCPWPYRFYLAQWLTGYATTAGGRNGTITRVPPFRHPEAYGCYATAVTDIAGLGQPFQGQYGTAFPVAKLSVQFGTLPYQPFPDMQQNPTMDDTTGAFVYCEQNIEIGEESIEVPGSALVYDSASTSGGAPQVGLQLQQNLSYGVPITVVRFTFFAVPTFPDQIFDYQGCVNDQDLWGCPRGTLLYMGSTIGRSFQSNGAATQTITNTYKYRKLKDWNYEINPKPDEGSSVWMYVRFKAGGYRRPYADLSQTLPNPNYAGGSAGSAGPGGTP